jgi:hypothetical protein
MARRSTDTIRAIDRFYDDPANLPIPIAWALPVVVLEFHGTPQAGIDAHRSPLMPAVLELLSQPIRTARSTGPNNPAAKGSYVTIYFTGGGQTTPAGVTGSVTGSALKSLIQPISVMVGNQPATVQFDGSAPTFVDGVDQLNIQLAADTPSGSQPICDFRRRLFKSIISDARGSVTPMVLKAKTGRSDSRLALFLTEDLDIIPGRLLQNSAS